MNTSNIVITISSFIKLMITDLSFFCHHGLFDH